MLPPQIQFIQVKIQFNNNWHVTHPPESNTYQKITFSWVSYIQAIGTFTASLSQNDERIHINVKEKWHCGYCRLQSGHCCDGSCKLMPETAYLLKNVEVDNLWIKLTHHDHDIRLQLYTAPENCTKLTQTPPKTKFLCVQRYRRILQDGMLSQSINMTQFFCAYHLFLLLQLLEKNTLCALFVHWQLTGCQLQKTRRKLRVAIINIEC